MKFDKSQLLIYAVTDRAWTGKMSLYEQTEAALKGGATMVQLREKGLRDDNVEEYLEDARNMGIEKVTGEYIYFLDSDDILPTGAIEKMLNACVKEDADMAIAGSEKFVDNKLPFFL